MGVVPIIPLSHSLIFYLFSSTRKSFPVGGCQQQPCILHLFYRSFLQQITSPMKNNESQALPDLSTRQKQYLKALAHPLRPLVHIGKEGISSAVISTVNKELEHHELIKVKIGNNSGLERHETSGFVAEASNSYLVQLIGKIFVLFRANEDKVKDQRIHLPKK